MHPQATISHRTSHRLRLHIPSFKRNNTYFRHLRDELSKCPGVESVEVNAQTGSVLVHHRSTLSEITRFADEMQLFALATGEVKASSSSLAAQVNTRVSTLNAKLTQLTKGSLDLPSASALGLVALGLFQSIGKRDVLPSGANMFWWAATLLARQYHDQQASAERAARRGTPARKSSLRRSRQGSSAAGPKAPQMSQTGHSRVKVRKQRS